MPPAAPQQPKHVWIADELRARIRAGTYGTGLAPMPSDVTLAKEFDVARSSVRQALDTLRKEGLVHSVHRRGTFVRAAPPRRLISMARYRTELAAADAGQRPDPNNPDLPRADVTEAVADELITRLFDAQAGTPVVRRHWVSRTGHVAEQMTTSYLPADLVPDIANPLLRVGVSPIPYLAHVGVRPDRVREVSEARMPTPAERSTLECGDGWVVAVTRQMFAAGRVVEVAREIVLPAQGVEFEHELDL